MSRARDNADGARLDAPLASPTFTGTVAGVTGTHITTGTLGNTVQDNITRLGTVTAGTLGSAVNLNHDAKKNSWHLYATGHPSFSSAVIDFDGNHFIGSNITLSDGRITVSVAGLYLISVALSTYSTTTTTTDAYLRVNGTTLSGTRIYINNPNSAQYKGKSNTWPIPLTAGQIVDFWGTGYLHSVMTQFTGTRIGAIS